MRRLHSSDPPEVAGYRLTGVLGDGGQGTVYLGIGEDGIKVAVKVLHARLLNDRRAVRRFLAEAATAEQVAGFCTARVIDSGLEEERPYLVSEYVDGPSLQELIAKDGPLTGGALERLAVGTATAMASIHGAGIVHRDFKPSNVLIGQDGPRVIDFGIARTVDSATTATSSIIGTPGYMAPEQIAGEPATAASDLFSWASTIGFAATGTPLFGGDSIPAVMHKILSAEPDLSGVAEPLRAQLATCLAKEPAERPTAQDVLDTLMHRTAGTRRTRATLVRRRRKRLAVAGIGGLVVAGGITGGLLLRGVPSGEQQSPQQPVVAAVVPELGQELGGQFGPANARVSALALGQAFGEPAVALADETRGVIEVWEPTGGARLWSFPIGSTQKVLSLGVAEVDGSPMAVWTDASGTLRTWHLEEARKGPFFATAAKNARMVLGERDGKQVAFVGREDGRVTSVDLSTGGRLDEEGKLGNAVTALAWDGEQVIAGSADGELIRGKSRTFVKGPIRSLAALGKNRIGVTAGNITSVHDAGLKLLATLDTMQPLLGVTGENGEILIAQGGKGLSVSGVKRKPVQLLAARHEITAVAIGEINGAKAVVAGIGEGRLRMWSLEGGSPTKE